MSKRKLWIPFVVGAGSFLGTVVYRRRSVRNRNRLDVYFDDGSFVTFGDRSPEAARLLPLARQVLMAARRA